VTFEALVKFLAVAKPSLVHFDQFRCRLEFFNVNCYASSGKLAPHLVL